MAKYFIVNLDYIHVLPPRGSSLNSWFGKTLIIHSLLGDTMGCFDCLRRNQVILLKNVRSIDSGKVLINKNRQFPP